MRREKMAAKVLSTKALAQRNKMLQNSHKNKIEKSIAFKVLVIKNLD